MAGIPYDTNSILLESGVVFRYRRWRFLGGPSTYQAKQQDYADVLGKLKLLLDVVLDYNTS